MKKSLEMTHFALKIDKEKIRTDRILDNERQSLQTDVIVSLE